MDATLKNGLTAKVEYKTSRILNLSMSACQLVETASAISFIGLGYKIVNFNLFSGRNVKDSKNRVSHDLALRADISFRNQSASAGTSNRFCTSYQWQQSSENIMFGRLHPESLVNPAPLL